MHEKERFVQRGGVFGLDDVVGDFDASGVEAVREIAAMIRTQPQEGVRGAMALAGSAAQSKFQLFPGDCDFFERVHILAPTREEAVEMLASTMIESVAQTFTNPHLQFVEMKLGLYPAAYSRSEQPVSQGSPISWGLAEMDVRVVRVVDATGESHRLRMHEVALDPGFVKLDWVVRGPRPRSRGARLEGDRRDVGGAGRHHHARWTGCSTASTRRSTSTRRARSTCNGSWSTCRPTGSRTTWSRSAARSPSTRPRATRTTARSPSGSTTSAGSCVATPTRRTSGSSSTTRRRGSTRWAAPCTRLNEAIRADRLDRDTIVAQLAALEGTIADCYTGADRAEILDLVRRLPEMEEDELVAATDRIAAASNLQVSDYFKQKIEESPGLKSVYDLVIKEAPGAHS